MRALFAVSESDPASNTTAASQAATTFGNYELLGEIARGGMGIVYRAQQIKANRVVALKMIQMAPFASAEDLQRFRLEAEAAAGLEHPNIVPIYEVGEVNGQPFYSMRLMEGGSLAEALRERAFTAEASAVLVEKIARALHFAHQRGTLHRDLKPDNILLECEGEPRISDFGLAKRLSENNDLTASGAVLGTPNYMAPEQAAGASRKLTVATDVYGLGAIFYRMLAGHAPFHGDTALETMRKVASDEPSPPSFRNPGLDSDLEIICLKCLDKDPTRRYSSALLLAEDLERWRKGEPIIARPPTPLLRLQKWVRRRPALAALILVTLLGALVFVWQTIRNETQLKQERDFARKQERDAVAQRSRAEREARRAESSEAAARQSLYAADLFAAFGAYKDGNFGLVRQLLAAQRPAPGSTQPELRGFEWWLLQSLTAGEQGQVFSGHTGAVTAIAFSKDGLTLASGGADNTVRLWEPKTGQSLGPVPPSGMLGQLRQMQKLAAIGRSPALQTLITNNPGTISYIEANLNANRVGELLNLAFTPDGSSLITSAVEQFVKVWDLGDRSLSAGLPGVMARISISPKDPWIAVGTGAVMNVDLPGSTEIYQLGSRQHLHSVAAPGGLPVFDSAGERLFVSTPKGEISVSDATKNFGVIQTIRAGRLETFAVSPNGEILASCPRPGRVVKLFDVSSGSLLRELEGHTAQVTSLAFTPNGSVLASGSSDQTVRLWDPAVLQTLGVFRGHLGDVKAVAFSPDGEWLASGGQDGTVRLWPMAGTKKSDLVEGAAPMVFSPDGRWLAAARLGQGLIVHDLMSKKSRVLRIGAGARPEFFATNNTSLIVSARENRQSPLTLQWWSIATGERAASTELEATKGIEFKCTAVSPDGRTFALGRMKDIALWEVATGHLLRSLPSPDAGVQHLRFTEDGKRLVSMAYMDRVNLWDVDSGQMLWANSAGRMGPIAVWNGARACITGTSLDHSMELWSFDAGKASAFLPGHQQEIVSLDVSPDGRTLASVSGDGVLKLWCLPARRELAKFTDPEGYLSASFSPDGQILATALRSGKTRLWRGDRVKQNK